MSWMQLGLFNHPANWSYPFSVSVEWQSSGWWCQGLSHVCNTCASWLLYVCVLHGAAHVCFQASRTWDYRPTFTRGHRDGGEHIRSALVMFGNSASSTTFIAAATVADRSLFSCRHSCSHPHDDLCLQRQWNWQVFFIEFAELQEWWLPVRIAKHRGGGGTGRCWHQTPR